MSGATKLMTAGGGGVSLTPASSIASDVTVNVPSQNCTLGIQGPAFSAYANNAQTLSNSTNTKISLNAETFDTNNNFDSTVNYRFTPTVAGYYQINGCVGVASGSSTGITVSQIYKNGSLYKNGSQTPNSSSNGVKCTVSDVVYMNGTTDYVELYAIQTTGGNLNTSGFSSDTYFSGCLVRAA